MQQTISIITVCFNSGKTIENAILSVLGQNYPSVEYIIVDGKSTDNTLEVISKYKNQVSKIISEKDHGIYHAINKGIKASSGDIIGLLHSDDFFSDENVLGAIADKFSATKADAVYSDLQYVSKDDPGKIIRHWKAGQYFPGAFTSGWMPPHPTFYVKKEIFSRYGNYNTAFQFASDYELMLRFIHKHGITLEYIPEVTVKMRVGGKGNISLKNRLLANAEDKKAWEVNGLKPPRFIRVKKPLSKLRQFL